jgi:formate hydrogenlyase subunit 3/multisubunit Na+/H+ antiporter MnhD subunit
MCQPSVLFRRQSCRDRFALIEKKSARPSRMQKWLIVIGVLLLLLGLIWPYLGQLGLGRLPGDIVIERDNFRFYFPIVTCLLASLVLSVLFWLLNR